MELFSLEIRYLFMTSKNVPELSCNHEETPLKSTNSVLVHTKVINKKNNKLSLKSEEQKQPAGQVDDKSPKTLQYVRSNWINNFS